MPKLTTAQMKKAVEEFKKQFTGGFYHGSPSPSIKAFDASKGDRAFPTEGVTFVTRDPDFADSFLPMNRKGEYEKGATMYPVNVKLGKHFVPGDKEGMAFIDDYVSSLPNNPNAAMTPKQRAAALKSGAWDVMEDPAFLNRLKAKEYDTFTVMEGGVPNVGVFKPEHIRGRFASYDPVEAASPEIMKAAGGRIVKGVKKALEHAKSMPVFHYSKQPSLTELDPRFYGSKEGIKGQEARRLKDAQDIRDRSYFYVDAGEDTMKPEQGLGPFKYQGTAHNIYDLANDPAGYGAIAKQKALDPYMLSHGREMVDPEIHANELERAIKGAGYSGYSNDKVGLTWEQLPVTRSE